MKLINKLSLIAMIFLSIMIALFYTGNRISIRYIPQLEAILKIKQEATTAHLWFEEIISGDSNEQIDTVWNSLEQSLWYANALLQGAEKQEVITLPLNEELLRNKMSEVYLELEKFRQIADVRYSNQQNSLPGSMIDQQFDKIFMTVLDKADRVEGLIQDRLRDDLISFQRWGAILLIVSSILSILIIRIFTSHEKHQMQHIGQLSQALQEIQSKNVQLENMVFQYPL